MKKKFLSILAAFAVLVSFSACQAGDTGQTPPLSEAVVSETTQSLETTIQSEIEQTSNLTFEDINIIEINGQQVSLPFKVEDLGEGYQLEEEYFLGSENEVKYALKYENNILAYVGLDENNNIINVQISSLITSSNEVMTYRLSVSNITTDDTLVSVRSKFGKPKSESLGDTYEYLFYQYDSQYLSVSFRDSKVETIIISLN